MNNLKRINIRGTLCKIATAKWNGGRWPRLQSPSNKWEPINSLRGRIHSPSVRLFPHEVISRDTHARVSARIIRSSTRYGWGRNNNSKRVLWATSLSSIRVINVHNRRKHKITIILLSIITPHSLLVHTTFASNTGTSGSREIDRNTRVRQDTYCSEDSQSTCDRSTSADNTRAQPFE